MSENPKNPARTPGDNDDERDERAQGAFSCPSPLPHAQTTPAPRWRLQGATGKTRRQLSPEEEAERRAEVRRRRRERIAKIDLNALPETIGVPEVALLLRVSQNAVYKAARRDEIPNRRLGRTFRFSRSAVLNWLGAQGPDPLSSK